jgi:hypothetical protein
MHTFESAPYNNVLLNSVYLDPQQLVLQDVPGDTVCIVGNGDVTFSSLQRNSIASRQ